MALLDELSPTGFTKVLIADPVVQVSGGAPTGSPSPTTVDGVPVAACLEMQSTTGLALLPRMTTAQRDAVVPKVDGMIFYNSSPGVEAMQIVHGGGQVGTIPNDNNPGIVTLTGAVTGTGPVGTPINTTIPALGDSPIVYQRAVLHITEEQANDLTANPILLVEAVADSIIVIDKLVIQWKSIAAAPTQGTNLGAYYRNNLGGHTLAVQDSWDFGSFQANNIDSVFGTTGITMSGNFSNLQDLKGFPIYFRSSTNFNFHPDVHYTALIVYLDYEIIEGI